MTSVQATVFTYDEESRSGSVALDDGSQKLFSAAAFGVGGLRLLRPGQRVRLSVDESGEVQALTIVTLGEP